MEMEIIHEIPMTHVHPISLPWGGRILSTLQRAFGAPGPLQGLPLSSSRWADKGAGLSIYLI